MGRRKQRVGVATGNYKFIGKRKNLADVISEDRHEAIFWAERISPGLRFCFLEGKECPCCERILEWLVKAKKKLGKKRR